MTKKQRLAAEGKKLQEAANKAGLSKEEYLAWKAAREAASAQRVREVFGEKPKPKLMSKEVQDRLRAHQDRDYNFLRGRG
jgi:hypothetical protein